MPLTRLGVIGWPVAHSRSPAMHSAALAACGLGGLTYTRLPVPPELFEQTVRALPEAGFLGVNATIPHKAAALVVADEATERARAIGAANTLTFTPEGGIAADNTDAPGLIAALEEPVAGRTALVLGAGGAARAAAWALLDAGAREVRVWNRTPERARILAEELGATAVPEPAPADLLVNCTAAGLDPARPAFKDLPLSADDLGWYRCVVDLVYGTGAGALITAARERGLRTVDGLEILVRQGALSFERWTGRPPPLQVMRAAARDPDRR